MSCSADRQARAKISSEGVFLEQLEQDPARYLPDATEEHLSEDVVHIDLTGRWTKSARNCHSCPVGTRVWLSGTMVVARDIAHARIKEMLDAGEPMPAVLTRPRRLLRRPGKDAEGYASGSFGPTTAGRMDSYVDQFQAAGGSFVMLAKGNRSAEVTQACARTAASTSDPSAARRPDWRKDNINKVEVLEFAELGMEAVWRIEVVDFPAFVIVDDKGNDFFAETAKPTITRRASGPAAGLRLVSTSGVERQNAQASHGVPYRALM